MDCMASVYMTILLILILRLHKGYSLITGLVCPFGRFNLLCMTNGTVIRWTFDDVDDRLISTTGSESLSPFVMRDSSVLISRTSLSPLTSLLEISNTTADLNGTRIECSTIDGMETTVITVIGNALRANVSVVEEHYTIEAVTITLEWSQGDAIIYDFTVSTSPPTSVQTNGTTSTRAKLVLSYNTRYSVSVITQCGRSSTTTFQLHYVTCSIPVDLPPTATLTSYSSPALVGTTATVNCDGLNKTAMITCMEDGSWQPDVKGQNLCSFESTTVVTSTHMATQNKDQTGSTTGTLTTSTLSRSTEESDLATITIISSSLGTIMLSIIIIIITGIALFFVIKKAKQNGTKRAHEHNHEDEQHQMENNPSLTNDQNSNTAVYSLLQRPESQDNTGNKTTNNLDGKKQTQLIYADIGPLSSKQSRAKADLRVFDDGDRVQYAKVNIGLLQAKKQTHSPSVDKYPDIDNTLNLDCLLIQVKVDVTPEWYQFGKAIGVSDEVLNKCLQYPPDESVIEVCDNWLRNHSGKPSWREVAEALRQINCQQLAFDIENSYNTGKLPKSLKEVEPEEEEMAPPIPPRLAL